MNEAAQYDAWYRSARGRWIAAAEFALMRDLLQPGPGASLLDVGSGTGEFARRFAAAGLRVTAIDPDRARLEVARTRDARAVQVCGSALALPFRDASFDYAAAVTSLCFIEPPQQAVAEMWRLCRRGLVLGLLNRRSLLYYRKHDSGGYRGARWDRLASVRGWIESLQPAPRVLTGSAVFLPGGSALARGAERWLPSSLGWGGFLAVALRKD